MGISCEIRGDCNGVGPDFPQICFPFYFVDHHSTATTPFPNPPVLLRCSIALTYMSYCGPNQEVQYYIVGCEGGGFISNPTVA